MSCRYLVQLFVSLYKDSGSFSASFITSPFVCRSAITLDRTPSSNALSSSSALGAPTRFRESTVSSAYENCFHCEWRALLSLCLSKCIRSACYEPLRYRSDVYPPVGLLIGDIISGERRSSHVEDRSCSTALLKLRPCYGDLDIQLEGQRYPPSGAGRALPPHFSRRETSAWSS